MIVNLIAMVIIVALFSTFVYVVIRVVITTLKES